jgi:hypothetical protein
MQSDPSLAEFWPDDYEDDGWDEPDYDLELKRGEL